MSLLFEWDAGKARSNLAKHHVSLEEAMSVFSDPLAVEIHDMAVPGERHEVKFVDTRRGSIK